MDCRQEEGEGGGVGAGWRGGGADFLQCETLYCIAGSETVIQVQMQKVHSQAEVCNVHAKNAQTLCLIFRGGQASWQKALTFPYLQSPCTVHTLYMKTKEYNDNFNSVLKKLKI